MSWRIDDEECDMIVIMEYGDNVVWVNYWYSFQFGGDGVSDHETHPSLPL